MSSERFSQLIPTSGQIEIGPGNFLMLLAASASVTVRLHGSAGGEFGAANIGAGYSKGNVESWRSGRIIGAAGTSVTWLHGEEIIREDFTDYKLSIASLAGISLTSESPMSAVADTAPVVIATGNAAALFGANLARRRVRVYVDSGNAASCYARTGAATNNIAELQPGGIYTFDGTYGLFARNDTGANATFYLFEES